MSDPHPTGYHESPDTTDGPVALGEEQVGDGNGEGVTLTTDDEAQREDSVMRPGNEPD